MSRFNRTILLAITGILCLAVLLGINGVAGKKTWRFDLTADKLFSLSPQTVAVLKDMGRDVKAVAFFYPNSQGRTSVKDMFDLFKRETDLFDYEFVDPDRDPARAKELGVRNFPVVVLVSGERNEKITFPSEENVINGVIRVADTTPRRVYFVEGHGELNIHGTDNSGMDKVKALVRSQGMEVDVLPLSMVDSIPEDTDILAIVGPKMDFLDTELALLRNYLDSEGRLLVCFSAEDRTNLDDFIVDRLSIQRREGIAVDMTSKMQVGDPRITMVQKYSDTHPITRDFGQIMTMFPTAGGLRTSIKPVPWEERIMVQHLGRTSHEAWLETDVVTLNQTGEARFDSEKDTKGPLTLIASYEIKDLPPPDPENPKPEPSPEVLNVPKARAVVFGDQDFMTNQYLPAGGNTDLLRNTLNWLSERESILSLSKERENIFMLLKSDQKFIITWMPRAIVPVAALLMALAITLIRRPRKTGS